MVLILFLGEGEDLHAEDQGGWRKRQELGGGGDGKPRIICSWQRLLAVFYFQEPTLVVDKSAADRLLRHGLGGMLGFMFLQHMSRLVLLLVILHVLEIMIDSVRSQAMDEK